MNSNISSKQKLTVPRRTRWAAYFCTANDDPAFYVPVIIFYGTQYLDLSVTTTIILFYGIAGMSNFFEIPAGAFADRYGRRLGYWIGTVAMVVGLTAWLFKGPIIIYIVGRFIFCIGQALKSGTIDAMMYEESERHGQPGEYLHYRSRSKMAYYFTRFISIPLGAYLFTVAPRWTLIATIAAVACAGLCSILIPDNNTMPEEHTTSSLMKETVSKIFRSRQLLWLFIVGTYVAAISESFWRLFQPTYKDAGYDIKYIGAFYVFFSAGSLLASMWASKLSSRGRVYLGLITCLSGMIISYTLSAIFPVMPLIILFQFIHAGIFAVMEVPVPAYIQKHFEKYQQVTVLSVYSMMFWGGNTLGSLLIAGLLAFLSLHATYIALAVIAVVGAVSLIPSLYHYLKHPDEVVSVPSPAPGAIPQPDPMG